MAGVSVGTAYLTIVPEIQGIQRKIQQEMQPAAKAASKAGTESGTAFAGGMEKGLGKLKGALVGAIGAGAVAKVIGQSITAASNLEQSVGAVEAVFKSTSTAVMAFGKDSAQSVGLAESQYLQMSATFGSQLKNMGVAASDLAPTTDKLITLGADLAAQFGGDTSTAVEAIGSLMRGERNPIEKYGVSITAASVAAKKLEMGLGGLAGEQDKSATLQATLALLYDQTSDSQGAFAREADTFAGKQQRMNAEWENTKAAIGQAFMPAATSGLQMLGSLAKAVEPLGTALGTAVSWFTKLPGPIQLAAGAASAFAVLNMTGTLSKWGAAIDGLKSKMGGMSGGFASMAKGLALGGALGVISFAWGQVTKDMQRNKEMQDRIKQSAGQLQDALVESSGQYTDSVRKQQVAQIASTEEFKQMVSGGLDYGKTMDVLTGRSDDFAYVLQTLNEKQGESWDLKDMVRLSKFVDGTRRATGEAQLGATAQVKYNQEQANTKRVLTETATSLGNNVKSYATLGGMLGGTTVKAQTFEESIADIVSGVGDSGKAIEDMAKSTLLAEHGIVTLTEEQQKQADASSESITENTDLARAIEQVGDDSKQAGRDLDYFTAAMNKAAGRSISAEEAAADMAKAVRDSADAFSEASKDGEFNRKALVGWNVAALTSTKGGEGLYDSMNDLRGAYDKGVTAAYSNAAATGTATQAKSAAKTAADKAYASFIQSAKGMGIEGKDADKLAGKLGILEGKKLTDKQFDVLADDRDAQKDLKNVQKAKVDGKTLYIDGETKKAYASLEDLRKARVAEKTMPVGADTSPATKTANAWQAPTKTMPVVADLVESSVSMIQRTIGSVTAFMSVKPTKGMAGGATADSGPFNRDTQPWLLTRGEHILDRGDVAKMGGQRNVYAFRNWLKNGGGDIPLPAQRSERHLRAVRDSAGPLIGQVIQQPGQTAFDLAKELDRMMAFTGVG